MGKGKHQIDGPYLEIASAMNIVGDPGVAKEEIVVVGGFKFEKEIQGNCHLFFARTSDVFDPPTFRSTA